MNSFDFIQNLQEYYKPEKEIVVERIKQWIKYVDIVEFTEFFNYITDRYEYKSFPSLPVLKDYFKKWDASVKYKTKTFTNKVQQYVYAKQRQYDRILKENNVMLVIDWLIKAKKSNCVLAINLLNDWGELLHQYYACKDLELNNFQTENHCKHVFDCLKAGEAYNEIGEQNLNKKNKIEFKIKKVEDFLD